MELNRKRRLGRCAFTLATVLGTTVQAQPLLTGDAEADFLGGAIIAADPNGVDVGMPLQFPAGTVSGNDLKDIRFQYDAATDKMYVAFNTYGIASDVDADGDANTTGPILAGLGGTDFPSLGGTESFALLIDLDEDGRFDVTAGVSVDVDINGFAVTHFVGDPRIPAFAFGVPVAGVEGLVYSDPEPGAPDLEFSISGWSTLPTSGPDRSAGFRINAFLGSLSDAGIGEDFVPGIGETVRICQPRPEICNDFDDDCDGQVDEGFDVGRECRSGIGGCAVAGVVLCRPDGSAACTATPGSPLPEACDGIDNDCDGTTDEGIVGACTSNLPGLCNAGHLRCENATLHCDPNNQPAPERCDDLDNDCDGSSDEGLPVGQVCGTGVGACRANGIFVCDANGGIRCTGTPSDPHPETCDAIDNDCDGDTDEDFNVGDVCSTGVGACRAAGEIRCDEHGSITCSAEPGEPGLEVCNGEDDDCDNSTDEGLGGDGCDTGEAGPCGNGRTRCEGGRLSCDRIYEPVAEACDAVDNDCDGTLDEDTGRGDRCHVGVGACGRDGTLVCDGAGGTRCDARPGEPVAEICNGFDDDCDGSTDEGTGGNGCATGAAGPCGDGRDRCVDGKLECDPIYQPVAERCDAVDNDCDGSLDEDLGLGNRCGTGVGACRAEGEFVCDGNGGVRCTAQPGNPGVEVCNGADDDCDGTTDEGYDLGRRCGGGDGACHAEGEIVCDGNGGAHCSVQPGQPGAEVCNGADDDCDGRTDEGLGLGERCATGVGACRNDGQLICDGDGGVRCTAEPGQPGVETCNGADDDCDNSVDEGYQLGTVCREGQGACVDEGVIVCDGSGGASCDAQPADPTAESCNALDDDCDGETDEGLGLGTVCREGAGACADEGLIVCDGNGGTTCDAEPGQPGGERCNGVDDDCDGRTDEGFGLGERCGTGVGACHADGEIVCDASGGIRCSAEPGQPRAEICNAADDDCDGTSDEGLGVGDRCGTGIGACRDEGEIVCAPDGTIVCNAQPGQPGAETCNGQDDDCDNATDEGYNLGAACREGEGACADDGVIVCALGGGTECDATPGNGDRETCNGVDDDCDGATDEDLTEACGTDVGMCQRGRRVCVDGQYGACEGEVGPAPEVCNGWDDDCDGRVDEGYNLGGACREGVGACADDGVIVCNYEGGTMCNAQPGRPGAETCNNADDDCDGATDEDLTRVCGSDVGACQQGVSTCVAGRYGACDGEVGPARETCNGTDDDCDGGVDEGHNLGAACREGVGACADEGVVVCAPDGGTTCDAEPGQPGAEACNNIDDDCDGTTDEGLTRACGTDEGACEAGVSTCMAGQYGACEGGVGPTREVCNGWDDDCDGTTDEGYDLGGACHVGVGACGAEGVIVCNYDGGTMCSAQPGQPGRETCNGADDDCDGRTDEGFDLGARCSAGEGACQADGEIVCGPDGGATCNAQPRNPVAESCNGADDDCDRAVDEGFDVGGACSEGVGACANDGEIVCDGHGGATCSAAPGAPAYEACNGADDDCDGRSDEDFGLGEVCHEGQGACAADGVIVCDGQGGATCSAQPAQPGAELCDDLDNDCDGETDEGFGIGEICHAGTGACRTRGERICDGAGGARCDATPGNPVEERCDEADNDCDGRIDEDFPLDEGCAVGLGACRRDGHRICGESDVVAGLGGSLLINGSFEQPALDVDWRVYQEIPGWTTVAGQGIEIQRIWGASDGRQYVELDSHPEPGAGCMTQSVPVTAGAIYRLSFSHSARPNVGDNRIAFYWDGMEVAEVDASGIGRNATAWNHYGFDVTGNGDGGTLVICDVTGDADTLGGLVDDVRLEMIEGILCDAVPGDPEDERCDSIDNDCDGYTDEDLGVGQACSAGVGACAAEGTMQCTEDGEVVCTAEPGDPEPEQCDEIDNDCDGEVDEEGCACDNQARTQTPGGWGARAAGNNPGAYRDAHFRECFPRGLFLGDTTRDGDRCYTIELSNSAAVERFLPNGGAARALDCDALNPASSPSGVLSNHLAAAMLSVGFDRCDPDFGRSDVDLGDFVVNDRASACHGWTVDQVIAEGHAVLSGCGGRLSPVAIAGCLALINENFVDGVQDHGHLLCDGEAAPPPKPPVNDKCD